MKRVFALLLALFAFALSWAGVESSQPDRKIAPGDKLRMTCVEEPSLDKTYTVTADGLMLIDFLGAIQVN
ncbi:MAG: polysaccharide biosynthesis/export family protein, partial [Fimbriimonadaceae bacterium]|nr:polysaccharide biosynthesis/export family protein [Fimbriimonadaceae bacterium]